MLRVASLWGTSIGGVIVSDVISPVEHGGTRRGRRSCVCRGGGGSWRCSTNRQSINFVMYIVQCTYATGAQTYNKDLTLSDKLPYLWDLKVGKASTFGRCTGWRLLRVDIHRINFYFFKKFFSNIGFCIGTHFDQFFWQRFNNVKQRRLRFATRGWESSEVLFSVE